MTKKKDKINLLKAIKVLVTPWESGFTCGISMDTKTHMSTEEYELCSTIARGMIKMATTDPHSTFLWGLRGFADDKKTNKEDDTILKDYLDPVGETEAEKVLTMQEVEALI